MKHNTKRHRQLLFDNLSLMWPYANKTPYLKSPWRQSLMRGIICDTSSAIQVSCLLNSGNWITFHQILCIYSAVHAQKIRYQSCEKKMIERGFNCLLITNKSLQKTAYSFLTIWPHLLHMQLLYWEGSLFLRYYWGALTQLGEFIPTASLENT